MFTMNAVNFPFSTALAESHRCWWILFSFLIHSSVFLKISIETSSLTHELFTNMLFRFWVEILLLHYWFLVSFYCGEYSVRFLFFEIYWVLGQFEVKSILKYMCLNLRSVCILRLLDVLFYKCQLDVLVDGGVDFRKV